MGLTGLFKFRKQQRLERQGPRSKRDRNGETRRRAISAGTLPVIVGLIVWASASFCIVYRTPRSRYDLLRNQRPASDIIALTGFKYTDLAETSRRRERAAERVPGVWQRDSAVRDVVRNELEALFGLVESWRPGATDASAPEGPPDPARQSARDCLDRLNSAQLDYLKLMCDSPDKRRFITDRLDEIMRNGVIGAEDKMHYPADHHLLIVDEQGRQSEVALADVPSPAIAAKHLLADYVDRFPMMRSELVDGIATAVVADILMPNLDYDSAATRAAKAEAQAAVGPVDHLVPQGTVFIDEGQLIDEQCLEMLNSHNAALEAASRTSRDYAVGLIGNVLLGLLLVAVGVSYMGAIHRDTVRLPSRALLLSLTVAVNLLLMWAVNEAVLFFGRPQALVYPALPLALTPILVSLLLGASAGMSAGLILAVLATLLVGDPLHILALGAVAAVAGSLAVRHARTRVQTFRALLYVPVALFLVEAIFLAMHQTYWLHYLVDFGILFGTMLVALVLVNLALPLCEWIFGVTTNISLLELSDLNHPLLKRLNLEAPGTYHHTMQVATLAEHAAESIGANTLLARVASYFHDIGKLANPEYFTENSFGEDRHEDLSPRMSSMIIHNHVKEGLALARRYKLRRPILEAIQSHHGTSLVYYFYRRAKDENMIGKNGSAGDDFRYDGPRPRTCEAAIIGIADACEAASRSLVKPSPAKIDSLVNDIIRGKMLDGQLDQCALTMAQLHRVGDSIKQTLRNMLHGRIAYPRERDADTKAVRLEGGVPGRGSDTDKIKPDTGAPEPAAEDRIATAATPPPPPPADKDDADPEQPTENVSP